MSLRHIYDNQVQYLQAGDLDQLMAQYTEDAVLVRFDRQIRGQAALREFFQGYLEQIKPFSLVSTDRYSETEDAIFFEATVSGAGNSLRVYDVFMIRDQKISHHFAGVFSLEAEDAH